jgi:hypothetical protein
MGDSSNFASRRPRIANPSSNPESARSLDYSHRLTGLTAKKFKIKVSERQAKKRGLDSLRETEGYKSATKEEQMRQEGDFVDENHQEYLRRMETAEAEYERLFSQIPIRPSAIDDGHEGDEEHPNDEEDQEDELEMAGKAAYESIMALWYEEDETDDTSDGDDNEVHDITGINC